MPEKISKINLVAQQPTPAFEELPSSSFKNAEYLIQAKEKSIRMEKKKTSFETLFENTNTNAFKKLNLHDEQDSF